MLRKILSAVVIGMMLITQSIAAPSSVLQDQQEGIFTTEEPFYNYHAEDNPWSVLGQEIVVDDKHTNSCMLILITPPMSFNLVTTEEMFPRFSAILIDPVNIVFPLESLGKKIDLGIHLFNLEDESGDIVDLAQGKMEFVVLSHNILSTKDAAISPIFFIDFFKREFMVIKLPTGLSYTINLQQLDDVNGPMRECVNMHVKPFY